MCDEMRCFFGAAALQIALQKGKKINKNIFQAFVKSPKPELVLKVWTRTIKVNQKLIIFKHQLSLRFLEISFYITSKNVQISSNKCYFEHLTSMQYFWTRISFYFIILLEQCIPKNQITYH